MDREKYNLGEPDFATTSYIFAYSGQLLQEIQFQDRIEEARATATKNPCRNDSEFDCDHSSQNTTKLDKAPQQLELFPLVATQENATQQARDIGRTIALEKCPDCSCTQAVEYPGQEPYYKALRCACCDHFLRWLPKPKQDKGGAL